MMHIWDDLSALQQDILFLVLLTLPAVVIGFVILRGLNPRPLLQAMFWRFRWINLLFALLIAVSIGVGTGLLAQERGLRQGTAASAEKFDLIVTPPGSEISMMMATLYLQPTKIDLLSGEVYQRIATHKNVSIAAPLGFGDSYKGYPIVGTIPQFLHHLTDGQFEGKNFSAINQAVIGSSVPLHIGDDFSPVHGHVEPTSNKDLHDEDHDSERFDPTAVKHNAHLEVVGRMQPTGTPWDRAILVPIEAIWAVHMMPTGHAEGDNRIGPPFDPARFPGTPAILVHANELWANYSLRSEFDGAPDTMAFFPGAVLTRLYSIMGDIRQAMSLMSLATQILVSVSVIVGLLILIRLFQRQLSLLRALGAPRRFIFAVVWSYATLLLVGGSLLGLLVGQVATLIISEILTTRTDILIRSPLGWPEFHFVAGFISCATMLALLPAYLILRQQIVTALRS